MKQSYLRHALYLLCMLVVSSIQAQEGKIYKVFLATMEEGKAGEAMEMGHKYFSAALEKMGEEVIALRGLTGPYNGLILHTVPQHAPMSNLNPQMLPHMLEIAGSKEKLQSDLAHFNDMVEYQETNYFTLVSDSGLNDFPYVLARLINFKYGMRDRCVEIGMKYFNANLKKQGINAMALQAESGPFDLIVLDPKRGPNPMAAPTPEADAEGWKTMLEIAGSEELLLKELAEYNEGIDTEILHYYRRM